MIDLFGDDTRRNPWPLYAQLRAASPVMQDPRTGLWLVFDYDTVRRALNDHTAYSSAASPPGALTSQWLMFTDPPRHTKLRTHVMRAFTPRAVVALEPRIRAIAAGLLDGARREEIELIADFAMPLPMMVIAEMLGAPAEEYPRFRQWTDTIVALSHTVSGDARASAAIDAVRRTNEEMREYLPPLLDERRARPRDDLLSRLVQVDADGDRLRDDEILGFFQLLLLAGHETTTNLISNAVLSFIEHPDQLALLRVAPDLLASAVEEVLRYRSPVQVVFRVTHREVDVHGARIPAGRMVLLMLGAANRDPAQFENPDAFDITRTPNPHIAFGHGIHFCVGAPLARLEGRIALEEMLARWASFEHAGDATWEPREAFHVHGPSALRLRLTRK